MFDPEIAYQALTSCDSRFDGIFYVGVTSTGIYYRPICPVKALMQKNCLFFSSAEADEKPHFRPCLRCRPELAPGFAPVDSHHRIADHLIRRIEEGLLEEQETLADIANEFALSERQLRHAVQQELGVSPIELRQTRRMLLAKQLLTETSLYSMTTVEGAYHRTVALGHCRVWVRISHLPEKQALKVLFTTTLTPLLPALLRRLRDLFDLDAQPEHISEQLIQDRVSRYPRPAGHGESHHHPQQSRSRTFQ